MVFQAKSEPLPAHIETAFTSLVDQMMQPIDSYSKSSSMPPVQTAKSIEEVQKIDVMEEFEVTDIHGIQASDAQAVNASTTLIDHRHSESMLSANAHSQNNDSSDYAEEQSLYPERAQALANGNGNGEETGTVVSEESQR